MKWYATIGWHDLSSRDHVEIKKVISQLSLRLESRNVVGIHMRIKDIRDSLYVFYYIPTCHSYMSRDHVIY